MISVWADVGGTFTDCFVLDGQTRHETKVLSSGMVRATVTAITPRQLQVNALPASEVKQFWRQATASILKPDGTAVPVGRIASQVGGSLSFEQDCLDPFVGQSVTIELDPATESVVLATRIALGVPLDQPLPPLDVRMGTTRGTNALLTRRGANTALLVTEGFADLLRIGEQDRPDLFALNIRKPPPLTDRVVEVAGRLAADGEPLQPLALDRLRTDLVELKQDGVESLAICFLHAHVNPVHELAAEQLAREIGFDDIS
ncbi:MAG: hydantoinase/oxoprolinase N-terminal domain-containing protein, partial [Rubripirellula sp.]